MEQLAKLKNLCAVAAFALALSHSSFAHSEKIEPIDGAFGRASDRAIDEPFGIGLSAGVGRQYSRLAGVQLSLGNQRIRAYAGIGLLLFSAGADLALTQHLSTGVYAYVDVGFTTSKGAGGHLTYHLNSALSKGFSVGINVTNVCPCDFDDPDAPDQIETGLAFGYQFF